LLGRADPPLTSTGRDQARQLAATLPPPDLVVSSPLRRARETAAAFGADVEVDDRWTELHYGELDRRHPADVPAGSWARWREDVDFRPPGGESLRELGTRVRAACAALVGPASDGVVVVVSHVSPIKAAVAWALDAPELVAWRMWVEDAGVVRIDIDQTGPVLRWFNRGPAR
jgi:broad specificity phosphatase PhoE